MKEDEHSVEKEQDKSTPAPRVPRKRNETIYMKILVPSCAVGAIIGKGGQSIAQVQKDTTALIKLSKAHDLYPGTLERVCLIQGTREAVTSMHNYIMDRMLEKPDCPSPHCHPPAAGHVTLRSSAPPPQTQVQSGEGYEFAQSGGSGTWAAGSGGKLAWGRHKQVKILVPNCTAGLVIGKEGSYVKEIKEKTGAFIQVSQKSQTISLVERCITIAGEPDQCRAAVDLVIAKIAEDPQSTSCPTISYSHVRGPVASAYPTGSPFAVACASSTLGPSPPTAPAIAVAAAAAAAASQRYAGDAFIPSPVVQPAQFSPYPTALFHAALAAVSAGAGLDQSQQQQQQRSFYHSPPPHPPQPGLMFTSTATSQPTATSSAGSAGSSVQSVAPPAAADLYHHQQHQASPVVGPGQLMPAQWSTQVAGPEVNVGYEATGLPAPLNFAYYSANQPLLTSIAPSRHHCDVFPAAATAAVPPQVYTSSACFGQTNLTVDSGISSGCGGVGGGGGPGSSGGYALGAAVSPTAQQQLVDYLSAVQLIGASARSAGADQLIDFTPPPSAPAVPQQQQSHPQQHSGGGAFAFQSMPGFAMPQQFLPSAPVPPWYPSMAPFAFEHRSIPAGLVDPQAVVSPQAQHQQEPRHHHQQQYQHQHQPTFAPGRLVPAEPYASVSCSHYSSSSSSTTITTGCSGRLCVLTEDSTEDSQRQQPSGCVGTGDDVVGACRRSTTADDKVSVERQDQPTSGTPQAQSSGLEQATTAPKSILSNGDHRHDRQLAGGSTSARDSDVTPGEDHHRQTTLGSSADSPKAVVTLNGVSG